MRSMTTRTRTHRIGAGRRDRRTPSTASSRWNGDRLQADLFLFFDDARDLSILDCSQPTTSRPTLCGPTSRTCSLFSQDLTWTIVAAKREVSLADLAGTSVATLSPSRATRRITERVLDTAGLKLDYTLTVNSIEMAKQFAETGLGVTVLPAIAARAECAAGRLVAVPLSEWGLQRVRVALCTRHGRTLSKTAKAVLDLLKVRCTAS